MLQKTSNNNDEKTTNALLDLYKQGKFKEIIATESELTQLFPSTKYISFGIKPIAMKTIDDFIKPKFFAIERVKPIPLVVATKISLFLNLLKFLLIKNP